MSSRLWFPFLFLEFMLFLLDHMAVPDGIIVFASIHSTVGATTVVQGPYPQGYFTFPSPLGAWLKPISWIWVLSPPWIYESNRPASVTTMAAIQRLCHSPVWSAGCRGWEEAFFFPLAPPWAWHPFFPACFRVSVYFRGKPLGLRAFFFQSLYTLLGLSLQSSAPLVTPVSSRLSLLPAMKLSELEMWVPALSLSPSFLWSSPAY